MREIGFEELKQIQLDILKDVHTYCVSNNIKYSLAYGTLLSAVRHKGYIPWDDDIDIMMPRKDYERFIHTYDGKKRDLKVLCPSSNWLYYAPFANVVNTKTMLIEDNLENVKELGIKIDVFPIDSVPDNTIFRIKLFERVNTLKCLINIKNRKLPAKKKKCKLKIILIKTVLSVIPIAWVLDKLAKIRNYQNVNSNMVNDIVWCPTGAKGCFPRNAMDYYVDIRFENSFFKVLGDFDTYLRCNYGNYMQLPPEDQRIPRHGFKAFWKD